MGAAETKRMVKALQRRKSAEIAAVSIQKVVRGKAARAATEAEVARREAREQPQPQRISSLSETHMAIFVIFFYTTLASP